MRTAHSEPRLQNSLANLACAQPAGPPSCFSSSTNARCHRSSASAPASRHACCGGGGGGGGGVLVLVLVLEEEEEEEEEEEWRLAVGGQHDLGADARLGARLEDGRVRTQPLLLDLVALPREEETGRSAEERSRGAERAQERREAAWHHLQLAVLVAVGLRRLLHRRRHRRAPRAPALLLLLGQVRPLAARRPLAAAPLRLARLPALEVAVRRIPLEVHIRRLRELERARVQRLEVRVLAAAAARRPQLGAPAITGKALTRTPCPYEEGAAELGAPPLRQLGLRPHQPRARLPGQREPLAPPADEGGAWRSHAAQLGGARAVRRLHARARTRRRAGSRSPTPRPRSSRASSARAPTRRRPSPGSTAPACRRPWPTR